MKIYFVFRYELQGNTTFTVYFTLKSKLQKQWNALTMLLDKSFFFTSFDKKRHLPYWNWPFSTSLSKKVNSLHFVAEGTLCHRFAPLEKTTQNCTTKNKRESQQCFCLLVFSINWEVVVGSPSSFFSRTRQIVFLFCFFTLLRFTALKKKLAR